MTWSMNIPLSPADRDEILDRAARLLVEHLKAAVDLADLITIPLETAGICIGKGPKQTSRLLETRAMGNRKRGVSLKVLQEYQRRAGMVREG